MPKITTGQNNLPPYQYFMAANSDYNIATGGYSTPVRDVTDDSILRNKTALIAVDNVTGNSKIGLDRFVKKGGQVLFDSGIFGLCSRHAKKQGIDISEAFAAPPSEVIGFDKLFEQYIAIAHEYKDVLWGIVELDLGGIESKTELRSMVESEGIIPIPVFHPFTDDWAYLDYLLSEYDRVAIGQIARVRDRRIIEQILARVWLYKQKHPETWVHVLGIVPNQLLYAYPFESCDSSSAMAIARFGRWYSFYGPQVVQAYVSYDTTDAYGKHGWQMAIIHSYNAYWAYSYNWHHYISRLGEIINEPNK